MANCWASGLSGISIPSFAISACTSSEPIGLRTTGIRPGSGGGPISIGSESGSISVSSSSCRSSSDSSTSSSSSLASELRLSETAFAARGCNHPASERPSSSRIFPTHSASPSSRISIFSSGSRNRKRTGPRISPLMHHRSQARP
ncbi:MAG: hypothetical protein CXX80_02540 [Methanobacteriota archaeon]|nr:MAG: hypothetical protein CXX80_02540 [Euryarchaeota archaeon]